MVDFKKMMSKEYKEENERLRKEREKQKRIEEEIKNNSAHFTGHRPNNKYMFGYDLKHPGYKPIIEKITEIAEMVINKEGITRFLTRGALGIDTISFWCIHKLKEKYPHIKNIVVVPFKNQPIKWNENDKKWYRKMLKMADEVIYVDELEGYEVKDIPVGEYHVAKMDLGNKYMVKNTKITIGYFDGSKGGTANCMRDANKIGRMIIRIDPRYNYELDIMYGIRY